MKKFILFVAVCAVMFGCKKPPAPTNNPIFSVKYQSEADGELVPMTNGQTIIFDEYINEELLGGDLFDFRGYIYSEESFDLVVTVTRETVPENSTDQFCILNCVTGNGMQTQDFTDYLTADETLFYGHFVPEQNVASESVVWYDFHEAGKPDAKIKVKVIYRYNP
ncbi:MAG: hypothetical protein LBS50_06135 [Prevotellaceae bacterium]|jgi:hypothetical protein|nr:hypothetical protein [Prevotellaceae bacterium]